MLWRETGREGGRRVGATTQRIQVGACAPTPSATASRRLARAVSAAAAAAAAAAYAVRLQRSVPPLLHLLSCHPAPSLRPKKTRPTWYFCTLSARFSSNWLRSMASRSAFFWARPAYRLLPATSRPVSSSTALEAASGSLKLMKPKHLDLPLPSCYGVVG